ncbi:MAG: hypothetical protein K9J13_00445 [Saprospiraceae bacterium]|nr:hypothetical protein [Saprospiraceae bacterium]
MNWRIIAFSIIDIIYPVGKFGDSLRAKVMKPLFKYCGTNVRIKKGAYFISPQNVSLGNNVYIGNYCNFGAGEIILGDEVMLGPLVSLTATNHTEVNNSYRFGKPEQKKITIGKGVWIGANCSITAGCTIGDCVLIGAGTVLRRDIRSNVIVANKEKLLIINQV